ncbi:MAG: tetratricopeptide repeat protein [Bryobacteraceae bacterium]|nr:tetratricopeptide repeat protein [Solibacteraceae bacterium]MCO5353231.1 tetratricopeptide repeat protein [Bryobacteraceae bacterium]
MFSLVLALLWLAPPPTFTVEGRFQPATQGSVTIYGSTTPFTESTLSDPGGRFRFRNLEAGTYTLSVFVPGRGEARQTVVVTPSTADSRRRVRVEMEMEDGRLRRDVAAGVSMRALSIPREARREYDEAQKRLSRRDVETAEKHLLKAVEIAPEYGEAWNNLGTLAYQTQRYERAAEMFRRSLETDDTLYAPLVNLGGVLLNLQQFAEAEHFNRHAVLKQPGDALAQSQLGMNLLALGRLDQAEKHLLEAIRLDPAHFSHPHLHLAEVLWRRDDKRGAADVLERFLGQHPDYPAAGEMRKKIAEIRAAAPR